MKTQIFSLIVSALLLSTTSFAGSMYLIGTATPGQWSLDDAAQMDSVAPNVFHWVGDLNEGSLKFLTQKDWIPSYGPASADEEMVEGSVELVLRASYEAADNQFAVSAGKYALTVDLSGESPMLTVSIVYPEHLYILGPAVGGWDWDANSKEMTKQEDGIFYWTGTLAAGEMKFFEAMDFLSTAYGATSAAMEITIPGEFDLVKLGADDNKFIASAAKVKMTANLKTGKLVFEDVAQSIDLVAADGVYTVYDITGAIRMRNATIESIHGALPTGLYILSNGQQSQRIIIQ